ncbi:hypothetical protein KRE47_07890 [Elizabethkingia meningoseptica]|uniref:DUF6922 domain-containing protein n=1 Tax=Elizabethkingia meningoseptica TaxID=238 RepID=UPI0023AE8A71|nr:hypothetical protein [Elizabethkingia meningoseptica]MDE5467953.1 hypothetical protein [Elizabethkingia meningoseptica]MDE5474872.1 hypothetical protein [Elizabethkingia meningoseptica]MDE5478305.1 hypothetical protein [Elizabethkingia meningoseptica]MDE5486704.1 hypothetical protein [Elizabethkingia meningoseptica]MDE5501704.1 hypothetical protein [Elizabethkingia meningoseptica]
MKMKNNIAIPNFDHVLFWDTDMDRLNWRKAYKAVIARIIERGGQDEIDELVRFYGYDKVITAIRDEIYFLPNYAINKALKFFPEIKKEEMYCYLNRKDKPYHWI